MRTVIFYSRNFADAKKITFMFLIVGLVEVRKDLLNAQIQFVDELIHFTMLFCTLAQERMWSLRGRLH